MTFDEWWKIPDKHLDSARTLARQAWDAATEEAMKDHFKIGEEVEARHYGLGNWERCTIRAYNGVISVYSPQNVRRIPAWEPKDGEAVMFVWRNEDDGEVRKWYAGIYLKGRIYFAGHSVTAFVEYCKQFDPDKIGLPCDEV